MERRLSTTSDSSTDSRQSSGDSGDGVQSRVPKSMAPKVAVNPLQFVKVGPCELYRSAQEQLKKVEEIKKAKKECRDEGEDWQSNLDNWKCSRRKRQEQIIERVVEVKKFEQEEHDRNRRKSKTFSEMMQERNIRGRKTSLPVYQYDESNDLSDLGLSTTKSTNSITKTDEIERVDSIESGDETISNLTDNQNEMKINGEKSPTTDNCEQYTYEWAIQSYVNFTESRVKSKSTTSILDDNKKTKFIKEYPPIPAKPSPSASNGKVDTYLKNIEQNNHNDLPSKPAVVPKVSVNRRREMFEKRQDSEESNKSVKSTPDVSNSVSIKERLSSLEKQQENFEATKENKINLPSEPLVKNRLMSIEAVANGSSPNLAIKKSIEPVTTVTIKDRLSSLSKSESNTQKNRNIVEPSVSLKDRMNSLQSSINKEIPKQTLTISSPNIIEKPPSFKENDSFKKQDTIQENCNILERPYSPEDINNSKRQQHYRHRSLDSLDIDHDNVGGGGSFERVQSLEDLDYCRNYPPSTFSGDTDREDSGIHTADVSSSVSQADDYDLHLDNNILDDIKMNHQPPIVEEGKHALPDHNKFNYEETNINNVSSIPCEVSKSELEVGESNTKSSLINNSVSQCFPSLAENSSFNSPEVQCPVDNSFKPSIELVNGNNNNLEDIPETYDSAKESKSQSDLSNTSLILSSETKDKDLIHSDYENTLNNHQEIAKGPDGSGDFSNLESKEQYETLPEVSPPKPRNRESNDTESRVIKDSTENTEVIKGFACKMPINHSDELLVMKEIISPAEDNQYKGLIMDVYSETQQECIFNLNPVPLEPPKEKPPPPPVDASDEEDNTTVPNKASLRRLDSTKRIKKEIRQKRSSFLGIEANGDETYLEPEFELVRPPDMTALLAEERRIDRQLYRQSVCSESDSNQESRDSGVELDHKLPDTWSHSRNDSELYGNQSTTSEEDEIMKKEREIIETLEQEEKIRKQDLGEKLAMRLRELEAEKERIDWEHQNSENNTDYHHIHSYNENNGQALNDTVILRDNTRLEHNYHQEPPKAPQHNEWYGQRAPYQEAPPVVNRRTEGNYQDRIQYRKSLQDLSHVIPGNLMVPVKYDNVSHRRSMPNLQEVAQRRQPPPPPILPEKPHHNHSKMSSSSSNESGGQQMTRQTLQALSAAPRSRLISNDTWQAKRKQQRPENYNYQHWLIQEAEHRRITEQQQRQNGGQVRNGPVQHPCRNMQKWPNGQYYPDNRQQQPLQQPHHTYSNTPPQRNQQPQKNNKPLPDAIIQTLTQRVQRMNSDNNNNRRRAEINTHQEAQYPAQKNDNTKDKMLSVSGKKRCSHCGEELGRGAAMIIESLQLFYHIDCFKCCVCCLQLGDGLMGTDVRVRNNKLHCHNCYSSDDGAKFSCV